MFIYSISPMYREEFVPPRVRKPPGSFTCASISSLNLVNQKDISGAENWLLLVNACQNGTALVEARAWKARPIMPETEPVSILLVVCTTATANLIRCQSHSYCARSLTYGLLRHSEARHGDGVLSEDTLYGTRAVLNSDWLAVRGCHGGGRRSSVVFWSSRRTGCALRACYPQIGGSSIQYNVEWLPTAMVR